MAKRFTDTEKWKKKWYRELGSKLRDARQFILDNCDHAGIWEVDLVTLKHFTGQSVSIDEIKTSFNGKVVELENDKIFIISFIEFQYGVLKEESRPHQSVIRHLDSICIPNSSLTLYQEYRNGSLTIKDKDKEQDKEKDKEKDKESVYEISQFIENEIYGNYPRKEGKEPGLAKLKKQIKTMARAFDCEHAMKVYIKDLEKKKTEPAFIKLFSSWVSVWETYLDQDFGNTIDFSKKSNPDDDAWWTEQRRLETERLAR